jgi:trigger factor
MQVSVEKVSNIERRLTITVPNNQIEEAYTKQIDRIAKQANIKGFRPGKAPMQVITQRFGEDARKEAIGDVIQNALYKAIAEQNLRPISPPRVETKMTTPNQPFEFIASFEVLPEIEKVNFHMDGIEKLDVEVSAADLDTVIEQLCKQHTKWKVVERAAKVKDRVVIDYYATFDGKADKENKVQNYPLELGSQTMLPGFEDGLIGVKAGDERVLNLSFPADFPAAERAGKPIEFNVEVKQIFEADAPALDEKLIQQLGIKSGQLDELKTQIKQSLEQERDRLVKEKLKEQVFRQLLEQNPLEVPTSLVSREAKSIHDEVYPQHQGHDHHSHSNEEMAAFNEMAKKRVSLGLLIAEYAKHAALQVDNERVKQRIEEIASVYESPQEVVAWLNTEERRNGIQSQILEEQVIEKLIEGIPVKEKKMSYGELKGIRQ